MRCLTSVRSFGSPVGPVAVLVHQCISHVLLDGTNSIKDVLVRTLENSRGGEWSKESLISGEQHLTQRSSR